MAMTQGDVSDCDKWGGMIEEMTDDMVRLERAFDAALLKMKEAP